MSRLLTATRVLQSSHRRCIAPALCAWLAAAAPSVRAQTAMAPVQVVASRATPTPEDTPVAMDEFTAQQLTSFPAITLDDALRDDPSFSLFRRTSSLISNPTSQGVSLRGIGPSGASRTLVVLDGVPLNDPFGGWVVWSEIPQLSLTKVDIIHGGGSGIWGSAALAGSIELVDTPPSAGSGAVLAETGAFSTDLGEVAASARAGAGSVSVDATDFSTAGFYDLLPATRGAVDRPFSSNHRLVEFTVQEPVGTGIQAVVTGRFFEENRGNGTVLQKNADRLGTVSADVEGRVGTRFSWNALAYAERESFSALFTSVSVNRSTETPADDQFDVPSTAAGASITAQWTTAAGALTELGADARAVNGETREDLLYSGDAFTEVRYAGGIQDFAGIFLHHEQPLGGQWRLVFDARGDDWRNREGHDRQYSLLTEAPTLLATYPNQAGDAFSPNLGLIWKPASSVRLHAAAYHGFRLPTLNEYYRSYRVGTVTTDANPNLSVETLDGAEAGADFTAGPVQFTATGFADELYRSVGSVLVSESAAGQTLERANLDAVRVRGIETSARWHANEHLRFSVSYLLDDSVVQQALAEPDLQGLRLPEVPRDTLTGQLTATGLLGITADARIRWVSLQFDDAQNTLRLPGATLVDLELSRRFGSRLLAYVAAENIGNALVATSLSTAGLYTYDAPRLIRGGLRFDW